MSEIPFGFGKPNDDDNNGETGGRPGGNPANPFGFGGDIGEALHRFADLLSWQGGPVNWDLAKDVARQAAASGDRSVVESERSAVADAIRLAELWLDPATSFPSATTSARAWSRAEWIEATLPTWKTLVEPVAVKVVDAFGSGLPAMPGMPGMADPDLDAGELPAHMQQMAGPLMSMMRQMGGVMFGGQVGQALGALSREVVSSTDVGLPLAGVGTAALLPAGVEEFGSGLELPGDEVRLFVALREAACHRLFAGVPWLRGRVFAAVEEYARGITVDMSHMQEAMGSIDPTNPEALQEALAGGLFEPQDTPAQRAALLRLETLLALIEGWIDDVVAQAAQGRLSGADALAETVRRRRAAGGPAEQTFGTLIGLELRPRRMREAAQLWRLLREQRGVEGRDALWEHPDLLPTAEDLADPQAFVDRRDVDVDISGLDTPPDEA
ncbi:MAG TPA: zinc-dependent metalloprotease [Acidothermaceae bacterium]